MENITSNTIISWHGNGRDYTYYGEHLVIYVIIKSLCFTSETDIFYIDYIPIKRKKTIG